MPDAEKKASGPDRLPEVELSLAALQKAEYSVGTLVQKEQVAWDGEGVELLELEQLTGQ